MAPVTKTFKLPAPALAVVNSLSTKEMAVAYAREVAGSYVTAERPPITLEQFRLSPMHYGFDPLTLETTQSVFLETLMEETLRGSTIKMGRDLSIGFLLMQIPVGAIVSHTAATAAAEYCLVDEASEVVKSAHARVDAMRASFRNNPSTLAWVRAHANESSDEVGNSPERLDFILDNGLTVAAVRRTIRVAGALQSECSNPRYREDRSRARHLKHFRNASLKDIKDVARVLEIRSREWLSDFMKEVGPAVLSDFGFEDLEDALDAVKPVRAPVTVVGRYRSNDTDREIMVFESPKIMSALDMIRPLTIVEDAGYVRFDMVMLA